MRTALVLTLLLLAPATPARAQPSGEALRVYEEGKGLYDSRRFSEALEKFDRAAALEPESARWQYNRGLALRKLNRPADAREALLKARALDPAYKRSEIDAKLAELGGPPAGAVGAPQPDSDGGDDWLAGVAIAAAIVLVGAFIYYRYYRWSRRRSGAGRAASPRASTRASTRFQNDPAEVARLEQSLEPAALALARCEHALSAGEDGDARALVDRAAASLRVVRQGLHGARRGEVSTDELAGALARAVEMTRAAEARLRAVRGPAFDAAQGPRSGCFFCARPLATAESRHPLTLRYQSLREPVIACAHCARQVEAGQAPQVIAVQDGAELKHWSLIESFDPYVHAHQPYPGSREISVWSLPGLGSPRLGLGALAAGAAAMAAGFAAAKLLDLDAVQRAEAASEAARAAAESAASRRSSAWSDLS